MHSNQNRTSIGSISSQEHSTWPLAHLQASPAPKEIAWRLQEIGSVSHSCEAWWFYLDHQGTGWGPRHPLGSQEGRSYSWSRRNGLSIAHSGSGSALPWWGAQLPRVGRCDHVEAQSGSSQDPRAQWDVLLWPVGSPLPQFRSDGRDRSLSHRYRNY